MISKENYYKEKLLDGERLENKIKNELRIYALLRLLSFVIIFISVFVLIPKSILPGLSLSIIAIIFFLTMIKISAKKSDKQIHLQALIDIYKSEIKALNFDYSGFLPGEDFVNHDHSYSYDMDIFGVGSLFQYLNRTVTDKGKCNLASWLAKENLDIQSILNHQQAIKELTTMNDLLLDFRAHGSLSNDSEKDRVLLKDWVEKPVFYIDHKIWSIFIILLPALTLLSAGTAFFISGFANVSVAIFLFQLILTGIRFRHTSAEHVLISKRLEALKKYQGLLSYIEKVSFASEELKIIRQGSISDRLSASKSIKDLSKIVSSFDARLNFLMAIFLEGILLWDIRCMIKLERWKINQGHLLDNWIDAIAGFDTLTSLATYAFNNPEYSYPVCSNELVIEGKELGHVLLPYHQRVCNDFSLASKGKIVIITGANMAGKSTFLRTVATNLIIAMTGAPVCASVFIFKPIKIFSSMRTSDSLNKNESYFYAELKRLKEMLDRLQTGEELFIILDEILKGTNSVDKQKGSKAVLEQIISLNGTGIIATHDLELTKSEEKYPEKIKNMCFEIEIDQASISFDYKLIKGVTTKMNASILMKQMGIEIE
jgi:DNA mismatch repair ATPase MutS